MISSQSASELISRLNLVDESEELEAKTLSGPEIGRSVYETICSLSNEPDLGGGTILLGVSKEESLFPLYAATGVLEPDKLSADLASACGTMFNVPVRIDVHPEAIGKAVVLRVNVHELPKGQKPAYFKSVGLPKGAFRRVGPTDIRCTDEDLFAFFQGKAESPTDSNIVKDAVWDDLDPTAIGAYRKARRDANPIAEELNWSDQDMLQALGAVNRVGNKLLITATGLLTFGKTLALRRFYPSQRVDYVRVPGKEWVAQPEDSLESIDMRGPIVTLVSRVMAAIVDDLPKTLQVGDSRSGQRTETPVIPLRVIREAVVNSLMHRSYQVFRPVQVVRYANRLVIKNPGYSLKSTDRFSDSGSVMRNPTIAEILHETRLAETKGSGIRVMQQKMSQSGLSSPTFESNRDADDFTATFLFHHFLDESDWRWLAHFKDLELNEEQMRALIFVREVGAIDNTTYRSLTQTDTLAASKSLRDMTKIGLLANRGSGARTHYVAGQDMVKRLSRDARGADKLATIHANSVNMDASAKGAEVTFVDLPTSLKVAVRLSHLRQRLEPDKAKGLIEALCGWRPLSVSDIAGLLGKKPTHVSQKYLSAMVAEGTLGYLFPEMIQHPGQKYVATKPLKKGGKAK